eukprot:UN19005
MTIRTHETSELSIVRCLKNNIDKDTVQKAFQNYLPTYEINVWYFQILGDYTIISINVKAKKQCDHIVKDRLVSWAEKYFRKIGHEKGNPMFMLQKHPLKSYAPERKHPKNHLKP